MSEILIIEDDHSFRDVLKEMLTRKGFDCITACDGAEGMRLFRERPVPLVITDIIMPNKEGVETILELHRDFPDTKVIAISGGGTGNPETYLKAIKLLAGVKYTFQKPFEMKELLTAVKDSLGKKGGE